MAKLSLADHLLAEGRDVTAVCRALGVSESTYHRWRNRYGGLKSADAQRLRELEQENNALQQRLATADLEISALRELARGNF